MGPLGNNPRWIALCYLVGAAPAPVLGPLDQSGAKSVALDIAANRPQMLIALNNKALETALIQMPRANGAARGLSAVGVSHTEPAQAGRELAILLRPQHQMAVVGHEAPRQQACARARYRLEEQDLKVGIVLIAVQRSAGGHWRD